jgi:3-dehydroquinate dehydratase-2
MNGPGLAHLGAREPDLYGSLTQDDLRKALENRAGQLGLAIELGQYDSEGDLVSAIWALKNRGVPALLINPAAYSHYSIAVLDAMRAFDGPVVEVHLSQVFRREEYRRQLVTAEAANAVISGMGFKGYILALEYIAGLLLGEDEDRRS